MDLQCGSMALPEGHKVKPTKPEIRVEKFSNVHVPAPRVSAFA